MNNFKTETVPFFKFGNKKIKNLKHRTVKILKIDTGLITIEISKTF